MTDSQLEAVVFDFEVVLPELELVPIAARRALDHAGLRLSLQGWRSLSLEDRKRLVLTGGDDVVDVARVASAIRRASPNPQPVDPVGDPDPLVPPAPLVSSYEPARWIDPGDWSRMRALDRYALAHEHRRAIARNDPERFGIAFERILGRRGEARAHATPPPQPRRATPLPTKQPTPRPPARALTPLPDRTPPPEDFSSLGRYSSMVPAPLGAEPQSPAAAKGSPRFEGDAMTPAPRMLGAARQGSIPPPRSRIDPDSMAPAADHRRESSMLPPPPRVPSMAPEAKTRAEPLVSTHLSPEGHVQMVDVTPKPVTQRRAVASGVVRMRPETAARVIARETPKGEVIATARIAAIMAAKRTSDLIPLCHAVAMTGINVEITIDAREGVAKVTATAEAIDRTGVEMEAMMAVSVACLTIYDMLKGVDREMVLGEIKLLEKHGGRSGDFKRGRGA